MSPKVFLYRRCGESQLIKNFAHAGGRVAKQPGEFNLPVADGRDTFQRAVEIALHGFANCIQLQAYRAEPYADRSGAPRARQGESAQRQPRGQKKVAPFGVQSSLRRIWLTA